MDDTYQCRLTIFVRGQDRSCGATRDIALPFVPWAGLYLRESIECVFVVAHVWWDMREDRFGVTLNDISNTQHSISYIKGQFHHGWHWQE